MNVEMIGLTVPLIDGVDSAEEFIAYCARISNPGNQMNKETSAKLLKYLAKNAHWSPFEMVNAVFSINTTRDIAHQIIRHRSFSFQEFSQRYAVVQDAPLLREARLQDPKNRQNSLPLGGSLSDEEVRAVWDKFQNEVASISYSCYRQALHLGIAKEQARSLLPEGLTPTTVYMQGTIRSWIHYCALRMAHGTQSEHAAIAKEIWTLLLKDFPSLEEVLG